jgi:protein gp37
MSESTKIQWCDSTAGPWLICSEVSPGCGHCYARELMLNRLNTIARKAYKSAGFDDWESRPIWGDTAPRILTRDFRAKMRAMNRKPWVCGECGNAQAHDGRCGKCFDELEGKIVVTHRRRSFPSLIDWLDDMPAGIIDQDGQKLDPAAVLADFLDVIRECDQMVHILCTKRPENWHDRLHAVLIWLSADNPGDGSYPENALALEQWIVHWLNYCPPPNIILLTSVEDGKQDQRIRDLLKIPAVCHGLSLEPLLGPVIIDEESTYTGYGGLVWDVWGHPAHVPYCDYGAIGKEPPAGPGINWLIIGGESGPAARPCKIEWIRSLVEQGKAAGVATFVKQLGAFPITDEGAPDVWPPGTELVAGCRDGRLVKLRDKKGGDPAEWPEDLRVQEFPRLEF